MQQTFASKPILECQRGVYNCEKCSHPTVALTPTQNEPCDGSIYFCKFDRVCGKFSLHKFSCVHGGGITCGGWRMRTNHFVEQEIQNRVARYEGVKRL